MSEQRDPVDEVDAAAMRRALSQLTKAVESQHLSLTSACLVTAGLVVGFIGFGVTLGGETFKAAPLGTMVPLAVHVLVLTPLAAAALTVRTERVVKTALGVWGPIGLLTGFVSLHAILGGGDWMLGLGTLHLFGAAMLGVVGLWVLPGRPGAE
ncbi:MAG: hypothetical protein ACRDTM_10540 [Micromonosporaceae bacterium]